jgi:acyl-CoA thioester hydrolase
MGDSSTVRRWVFRTNIDVRFRDCDAMGHVNHAVYFTYLEQARWQWWHQVVGKTPDQDSSIILAHAGCDFRAPATFGEVLEVRVAVTAIGRTSFGCAYEIVRAADGRVIAEAETVQVTYDYARGTPIPIPDRLRTELERLQS